MPFFKELTKCVLALLVVTCGTTHAQSQVSTWYLPLKISDDNTKITFTLDSTWHMIHGTTSMIGGHISLEDPTDPTSIRVDLKLPIKNFDTDNSMRDEKMLEVMTAPEYPYLSFNGHGMTNNCTPALVLAEGHCAGKVPGELTIRDKTMPINLPITILKGYNNSFKVQGEIPVRWADFGIEDPSIFVARIDPVVTAHFEVLLQPPMIRPVEAK